MSLPAPPDVAVLHASAVAIRSRGILILGPSGSGKSALALDLISRGAELVADDRVVLRGSGGALRLSPPEAIAGLIEARGIGLLKLPFVEAVRPVVAVDLGQSSSARLPQCGTFRINSLCLPLIAGANAPNLSSTLFAGVNASERFPLYDADMGDQRDDGT